MKHATNLINAVIIWLVGLVPPALGASYTTLSTGLDKTATPYNIGINLNGIWYNFATITAGGVFNLPIASGGTGQATASAAFNALSPMTTAGDLIYGGVSGAGTRLPAGSSTQFLMSGTTPSWITMSGDATLAGTGALTLATVNSNVGSWGSATQAPQITVDAKGRITAAANVTVTPAIGSITGLGAGVPQAAAIATNANGGFPTVSVSATAPTSPSLFQPWLDTTAAPYVWKIWTGAWTAIGTLDPTTHAFTSPTLNIAATPSGGFGGVSGILPSTSFPALTGDCTTASGAVATNCVATPTGAGTSTLKKILDDLAIATNYGAVCDGATDIGPALNTMYLTHKDVVLPANECASNYVINTAVTIPAGGRLLGNGAPGISTTASVTTLIVGGDKTVIDGLNITHTGATGYVIDEGTNNWGVINNVEVTAKHGTNASAAIHLRGAQIEINRARVINCRPNGYAVDIDGSNTPGTFAATVNPIISNSFIFGSSAVAYCNGVANVGPGIHVWSSDNTARPEGVVITATTVQMEGHTNLQIEQVNNFDSIASTYDSATAISVNFKPTNTGISYVTFTGGYIATPVGTGPTSGICANYDTTGTSAIQGVTFQGVNFGICGYGVNFNAATATNTHSMNVSNNHFGTIGALAINVQNWRQAVLNGNSCDSCTAGNLVLVDGASGGPYSVDANQFDAAGPVTITQTTPSKFNFGVGNTGKVLAGYSSNTVSLGATGCTSLTIAHGLSGTPNANRVLLTGYYAGGSSATNITVSPVTVDATNITAQVCATVVGAQTLVVNAFASL